MTYALKGRRERQELFERLVREGKTALEIAQIMHIGENTVYTNAARRGLHVTPPPWGNQRRPKEFA